MLTWHIEARELQLRYTWKIARNAADTKINLFVRVTDQWHLGMGEAAPNVRYSETPELLLTQFQSLLEKGLEYVRSLPDLQTLLAEQPVANALRFAVESAYVHFLCLQQRISVSQFLHLLPVEKVPTIFTLPIMAPELIGDFIQVNNLNRFHSLKVKVNQTEALALVQAAFAANPQPFIIDGNEAWTNPDDLVLFLQQVKDLPVLFVEQPLPASQSEEYRYLKKQSPFPIFADESVTDNPDFSLLRDQFHGVNMKLMKAGGYRNGLRLLAQTRAHGLGTMLGCMVETSLGIWGALQVSSQAQVCDLDGFLVVRDEPFGLVREDNGLLSAQTQVPDLP